MTKTAANIILAVTLVTLGVILGVFAYAMLAVYGLTSILGWGFVVLAANALFVAFLAWAFRKEI